MALEQSIVLPNGYTANYWRIIQLNLDWGNSRGRLVMAGYKDRDARLNNSVSGIMDTRAYRIGEAEFTQYFDASSVSSNDSLEQTGMSRELAYGIVKGVLPEFAAANDYLEADAELALTRDFLTIQIKENSTSRQGEIEQYEFDFGDGTTLSVDKTAAEYTPGDEEPAHTYSAAGDYTVSLTVTASDGYTNTETLDITVQSAIDAETSVSTAGLDATFTDASESTVGSITTFEYDFGDGTSGVIDATAAEYTAGDENVTHTYDAAGSYDVVLTVTDDQGNVDATTVSVEVAA